MTSSPHTRRLIASSHNIPACYHSQKNMFMMCATTQTCCAGHSFHIQYQAMVDIRATTETHNDIADVLLSINGTYTLASLHVIGNATVLKMHRKEGLSLSEIGDVKVDKTHDHDF